EPGRHQQAAQDVEAAIAADADQAVECQPLEAGDHLARTVLLATVGHGKGEGIAAVGATEEGAALARQRRIEARRIEFDSLDRALQQTERAGAQAHRRPSVAMMGAKCHGADGGVEVAAIAAAGQDADSLGHAPPPRLTWQMARLPKKQPIFATK